MIIRMKKVKKISIIIDLVATDIEHNDSDHSFIYVHVHDHRITKHVTVLINVTHDFVSI